MSNLSTVNETLLPEYLTDLRNSAESPASGVSWGAVIGGALVAASMALILSFLGVGLGLSSISPWSGSGASAATIGVATIIWLIATQAIAAGLGGYIAGRLRTKWTNVHTDEIYFRDTAHGFLVWAVGVVVTATFLASAASCDRWIHGEGRWRNRDGRRRCGNRSMGCPGTPARRQCRSDVPANERQYECIACSERIPD